MKSNATIQIGAQLFSTKSIIAHMIVKKPLRVYARLIPDDITVCEVFYIGSWWTVDTKYVLFDLKSTA